MTRSEHYAEAEKWLEFSESADREGGYELYCVARAQVHATLAAAAEFEAE